MELGGDLRGDPVFPTLLTDHGRHLPDDDDAEAQVGGESRRARRLEAAGAASLVLFNRLFQPDIDIEALEVHPSLQLSSPAILKLRLLWLAAIYGKVGIPLAASGGVHGVQDVIKAVMAGASVVQLTSALLQGGTEHMSTLRRELEEWLVSHEYESLRQMRGSMSLLHCPDPEAYERANYIRTLQTWKALTR